MRDLMRRFRFPVFLLLTILLLTACGSKNGTPEDRSGAAARNEKTDASPPEPSSSQPKPITPETAKKNSEPHTSEYSTGIFKGTLGALVKPPSAGDDSKKARNDLYPEGQAKDDLPLDEAVPQKIVTFAPAVLEFLDHCDLHPQVIADLTFLSPERIQSVSSTVDSKNFSEADIQKIQDFKPDVIFITDITPDILKNIRTSGRIVTLPVATDFYENFLENQRILSRIFGVERKINYDLIVLDETKRLLGEKAKIHNDNFTIDTDFSTMVSLEQRFYVPSPEPVPGIPQPFPQEDAPQTDAEKKDPDGIRPAMDGAEPVLPEDSQPEGGSLQPLTAMERRDLEQQMKENVIPGGIDSYHRRLQEYINFYNNKENNNV